MADQRNGSSSAAIQKVRRPTKKQYRDAVEVWPVRMILESLALLRCRKIRDSKITSCAHQQCSIYIHQLG